LASPPIESEMVLDLGRYELRRGDRAVRLEKQPMELLILLVENQGQLVTREQIVVRLWEAPSAVDTERSINTAIRKIRLVLRDDPDKPRFVQTVVGKGYRFIAPVRLIRPEGPPVAAIPLAPPPAAALPMQPAHHPAHLPLVRWLLFAGAFALAAALAASIWPHRPAANPIQSLAVLPLQNLSGEPTQDYVADGMTDELITSLAGIRSLRVISRTTAMQYRNTHRPLPGIAAELHVDAIVEGSVVRSGERVRITAQLIQARTDRHLWARSYEGSLRDLLALEREVARSIANEVRSALTPTELAHFGKAIPFDPEAYQAYLKGRYYWNDRTAESLKKSLALFDQAVARDPRNPLPYAGQADAYNMFGNYQLLPPGQAFPKAEEAARKALSIDDSLAEAHASLGFARYQYDWDWSGAEGEFRRAIELSPSYATAHQWYAEFLTATGRFDEALSQIRYAQALDPLSLPISSNVGRLLYLAGRYDQAIAELKNSIELHPQHAYSRIYLGMAYEQKQMYPQALAEFKKAADLLSLKYFVGVAHVDALMGRRQDAERILQHWEAPLDGGADPFLLAGVYAALGDHPKAFALLERAYAEHSFLMCFIRVMPWMDPLRPDPQFARLLSRMGLPQQ
jgi:TolB-like protein/DNA-binding winged helix-turn-helix (wHTH) protein/Flp pilus assembly protein TadD